jgi:hypothetical protein
VGSLLTRAMLASKRCGKALGTFSAGRVIVWFANSAKRAVRDVSSLSRLSGGEVAKDCIGHAVGRLAVGKVADTV